MPDRPEIIMPHSPAGAVEQMMLEELRRVRTTGDKLVEATNRLETQLALLQAENERAITDRREDRAVLTDHGLRLKAIEDWKAETVGARKGLTTVREWAPAAAVVILIIVILVTKGEFHL